MKDIDKSYCGIPWKDGGRTRSGSDCVGIVWLWLTEQAGFSMPCPSSTPNADAAELLTDSFDEASLRRGHVIFFREQASGKVRHVAIYLGENKVLHILKGGTSRIENGFTLLRRCGCEPVDAIPADQIGRICAALADKDLGEAGTLTLIALAIVLSLVSYALTPSLSGFKNRTGRYGQDALITQRNPEIPLADLLGTVVVAGNSIYQQLPDKNAVIDNDPPQQWNQVIVLASGPSEEIDYRTGMMINGVSYQDKSFFAGGFEGVFVNPAQTKAEAVSGSIGDDTFVPTVSLYDGAPDISVPVDIRAQYDRTMPIYGLTGCTYLVFRFADSSKFQNFNLTIRVKCRRCRTFDSDGFTVLNAAGESLTGADGTKMRFKLANDDIKAISSLTVNGTPYTEISAATQTGNVYQLNKTKGFIEFITAPAAAATIAITYNYYEREWTQNPAMHVIYLLTDQVRGKGFKEDRISWSDAVDARDYYDETVDWVSASGSFSGPRYQTNYAIDYRKPIQDHIQALLDACHSVLFLSNGRFILRPKQNSASVMSFDSSNILVDDSGQSTFEMTLVDRSQSANRIKLLFSSEDTLNAETEVKADDADDQVAREDIAGNEGVIEENLKYPAVTDASQAERLAETNVREQVYSGRVAHWKTNIKAVPLQPGDVVDTTRSGRVRYWRIESINHDEFDRLEVDASELVPSAYF